MDDWLIGNAGVTVIRIQELSQVGQNDQTLHLWDQQHMYSL